MRTILIAALLLVGCEVDEHRYRMAYQDSTSAALDIRRWERVLDSIRAGGFTHTSGPARRAAMDSLDAARFRERRAGAALAKLAQ